MRSLSVARFAVAIELITILDEVVQRGRWFDVQWFDGLMFNEDDGLDT